MATVKEIKRHKNKRHLTLRMNPMATPNMKLIRRGNMASGEPNDASSATAATRCVDWNRDAMPPFAAAHG